MKTGTEKKGFAPSRQSAGPHMPAGKRQESLKSMPELIAGGAKSLGYSNRINVYCVDEPAIVPE